MPDKRCLLSWDLFVADVANITWIVVYDIDMEPGKPKFSLSLKSSVRWDVLPDGSVRRQVAFWSLTSNSCFYADNTYGSGSCSNTAKLEATVEEHPVWFKASRVDKFASSNPEKFVIFMLCFDADQTCQGYCEHSYIAVLVKDQRVNTDELGRPIGNIILSEIPWCEIEYLLNDCVDATMGDNSYSNSTLLNWGWRGANECRFGDQ